jgi:hypothetical protein
MGLTIHYELKADGSEALSRKLVGKLHLAAQDLPFEEVGQVTEFRGDECNTEKRDKDDPHRWMLTQAHAYVEPEPDRWVAVVPEHIIAFETWPGDGCEPANFGLCRFPREVVRQGQRFGTGLANWSWKSFCKTQYASDPDCGGVAHFLRCHLVVIAMLDEAKKLGCLGDVNDEGGFWKNRSIEVLAKSVGDWNEMIAAFGGAIKSLWGETTGGSVFAPIIQFPNFEHLEAEGQKHLPAVLKVIAEIERLRRKGP